MADAIIDAGATLTEKLNPRTQYCVVFLKQFSCGFSALSGHFPDRKINGRFSCTSFQLARLQPSDTAYPRFKSRLSSIELERFHALNEAERIFCDGAIRSDGIRLGCALLRKTYQWLGYCVTSVQVPGAIVDHIGAVIGASCERGNLRSYDAPQARRKHLSAIRQFQSVKAFSESGKQLLR